MESRSAIIQSAIECTRNARACVDPVHVARALRWNRELNRLQGKPAYEKRLTPRECLLEDPTTTLIRVATAMQPDHPSTDHTHAGVGDSGDDAEDERNGDIAWVLSHFHPRQLNPRW